MTQVLARGVESERVDAAAVITKFGQRLALPEYPHIFGRQLVLPAQVDYLQVGTHGFGQHPHAGSQVIRLRSQPLGAGCKRVVTIAAPEIQFIGKFGAQGIGGQAEPVRQFDAEVTVYVRAQPYFVQLRSNARIGGDIRVGDVQRRLQQRKRRGLDDTFPRPGLFDPGNRLGKVEVRGQRRFDYPVENRVRECLPPFCRLVGAGDFSTGKLTG